MLFKKILYLFLFFHVQQALALQSPQAISNIYVAPNDPYMASSQASSSALFSFESLYPDLYGLGIKPLNDLSTTRLLLKGSNIIPYLGSSLFSTTATTPVILSYQHVDPTTAARAAVAAATISGTGRTPLISGV